MASEVLTASGTITTNGQQVAQLSMTNARVSLYVSGTFTGSMQLQARPSVVIGDALFEPVTPTGTTSPTVTTGGLYVFPYIPGDFTYQLASIATITGTAYVVLSAGPGG